jgi:hypothetical protein
VTLDDGNKLLVDHVLLGTGYRVDLRRYPFLESRLRARIDTINGFPRLNRGYESSVAGLHFVGAPAAWSFGPGMRFVSHTGIAAQAITRAVFRRVRRSSRLMRRI